MKVNQRTSSTSTMVYFHLLLLRDAPYSVIDSQLINSPAMLGQATSMCCLVLLPYQLPLLMAWTFLCSADIKQEFCSFYSVCFLLIFFPSSNLLTFSPMQPHNCTTFIWGSLSFHWQKCTNCPCRLLCCMSNLAECHTIIQKNWMHIFCWQKNSCLIFHFWILYLLCFLLPKYYSFFFECRNMQ